MFAIDEGIFNPPIPEALFQRWKESIDNSFNELVGKPCKLLLFMFEGALDFCQYCSPACSKCFLKRFPEIREDRISGGIEVEDLAKTIWEFDVSKVDFPQAFEDGGIDMGPDEFLVIEHEAGCRDLSRYDLAGIPVEILVMRTP